MTSIMSIPNKDLLELCSGNIPLKNEPSSTKTNKKTVMPFSHQPERITITKSHSDTTGTQVFLFEHSSSVSSVGQQWTIVGLLTNSGHDTTISFLRDSMKSPDTVAEMDDSPVIHVFRLLESSTSTPGFYVHFGDILGFLFPNGMDRQDVGVLSKELLTRKRDVQCYLSNESRMNTELFLPYDALAALQNQQFSEKLDRRNYDALMGFLHRNPSGADAVRPEKLLTRFTSDDETDEELRPADGKRQKK